MNEAAQAEEMLPLAMRVANRMMNRDPEADSLAGISTLLAIRTYDEAFGVPLGAWVVYCVKIDVYNYWRKRRARSMVSLAPKEFWETVSVTDTEQTENSLTYDQWLLLHEKYVDLWPDDVIARRHFTTVYRVRQLLAEAVATLQYHL